MFTFGSRLRQRKSTHTPRTGAQSKLLRQSPYRLLQMPPLSHCYVPSTIPLPHCADEMLDMLSDEDASDELMTEEESTDDEEEGSERALLEELPRSERSNVH